MGFKLIDPNAGRFGFNRGRPALTNTVRIASVNKSGNALRVTISEDLLKSFELHAGAKINLMIGTDEDFGSLCITKTAVNDALGYSLFKSSKQSRAASFIISSGKIYNIKVRKAFDCVVVPNKRALLFKIPASALGFQAQADHPAHAAA